MKLTKSMIICSLQNEQTHATVQTVTESTIKDNWPSFLSVNNGYTSLHTLIKIHY